MAGGGRSGTHGTNPLHIPKSSRWPRGDTSLSLLTASYGISRWPWSHCGAAALGTLGDKPEAEAELGRRGTHIPVEALQGEMSGCTRHAGSGQALGDKRPERVPRCAATTLPTVPCPPSYLLLGGLGIHRLQGTGPEEAGGRRSSPAGGSAGGRALHASPSPPSRGSLLVKTLEGSSVQGRGLSFLEEKRTSGLHAASSLVYF